MRLSAISTAYRSRSQEKGIVFSVKHGGQFASLEPEQLKIHDADLSAVFGNLLENALTAASVFPASAP